MACPSGPLLDVVVLDAIDALEKYRAAHDLRQKVSVVLLGQLRTTSGWLASASHRMACLCVPSEESDLDPQYFRAHFTCLMTWAAASSLASFSVWSAAILSASSFSCSVGGTSLHSLQYTFPYVLDLWHLVAYPVTSAHDEQMHRRRCSHESDAFQTITDLGCSAGFRHLQPHITMPGLGSKV